MGDAALKTLAHISNHLSVDGGVPARDPGTRLVAGGTGDVQEAARLDVSDRRVSQTKVLDAPFVVSNSQFSFPTAETPASREASVVNNLSPAGRQAFANLPADQKVTFVNIHLAMGEGPNPQQAHADLDQLLTAGKLTAQDSHGKTTLDNLDTLFRTPLELPPDGNPATYAPEQLECIVGQLAHPGDILQSNHGTCSAAVSQKIFASDKPSDYVAFCTGIIGPGHATLPNGTEVHRVPDSVERTPGDQRPATSRMVQSSLMSCFRSVPYSNKNDDFGVDIPKFPGMIPVAMHVRVEGGGMSLDQFKDVIGSIRNEPTALLLAQDDANVGRTGLVPKSALVDGIGWDLNRQRDQGHATPSVPAGLHWRDGGGDGGHEVLVTHVSPDRVYFQNTQDRRFNEAKEGLQLPVQTEPETGKRYIELPEPNPEGPPGLRMYEDGTQSFPRDQFESLVAKTTIDPGIADRYR